MGRAPTSGKCHTCRQRRVTCDKARPACARCLRGGFVCQGYAAVLRVQRHAAVAVPGAAPGHAGALRLARVQTASSYPAEGKPTWPDRRSPSHALSPSRAAAPPPPPEISLVGFVDDVARSYFFQAYGWINMHSLLLQDAALRGHLESGNSGDNLDPDPDFDRLAQDSLRALSYGLLGRDKHSAALQDAGRRANGRALGQLRRALATTGDAAQLAALVKPVALLGSYSIAVERDRRFTHHAGLVRLLEVCGPAAFQTPQLLPVFEAVRMTLIADAFVRRKGTVLARPAWKTVPWAACPVGKSATGRLLDVLADVPALLEAVVALASARTQWIASGGGASSAAVQQQLAVVAQLQARVQGLRAAAAAWHSQWVAADDSFSSPSSSSPGHGLAARVLAWAYGGGAGDDSYRPGVHGVHGPDLFDTALAGAAAALSLPGADAAVFAHEDPVEVAAHMQDAALYTTLLVWAARIDKYLAAAAAEPTCADFLARPFRTAPPRGPSCDPDPPLPPLSPLSSLSSGSAGPVDDAMAWNAATCALATAPVCCTTGGGPGAPPWSSGPSSPPSSTPPSPSPPPPPPLASNVLLPGDIRFAAHMRLLSWLCARLPATRGPVLVTLAAVGLAHCTQDVRPVEGHAEIAAVAVDAVARVLHRTGVDGVADILLRRYERSVRTAG